MNLDPVSCKHRLKADFFVALFFEAIAEVNLHLGILQCSTKGTTYTPKSEKVGIFSQEEVCKYINV